MSRRAIPTTATAGAMVATAMRVVNAVPYVVAARPGLLSSLDLPLTLPRHAFVDPRFRTCVDQGVSMTPERHMLVG